VVLTEKAERFGVTWGKNGTIVFAGLSSGLKSNPEAGGEPQEITQLDVAANEISHRFPHFLPDANGVLFTVLKYRVAQPDWKAAQIWVYSGKTRQRKLLLEDALDARYVEAGILVFARQAKLYAVGFDAKSLSIKGTPVPVIDGVTHSLYTTNAYT